MQNTTQALISALKARHVAASDYRVAKIMGWSTQAVSNYQNGKTQLDNRALLQIAAVLELSAADVVRYMAQIEAERARTDEQRATWAELCRQWGGRAASLALAVAASLILANPDPANAAGRHFHTSDAVQFASTYCFQKCKSLYRRGTRLFASLLRLIFQQSEAPQRHP